MKTLGITGGVGSGKTTVCKILETLGAPVFYSDEVSKSILFSDGIISEIRSRFGDLVFSNGKLDKNKLSKIVFNDNDKLNQLNSLLHPKVGMAFEIWKRKQDFPFVVKEAAILFESGSFKSCDFIVNVSCSKLERINRVIKRDNKSLPDVEAIIARQWSEIKRNEKSDFTIENETKKLIPQVLSLFSKLLILS